MAVTTFIPASIDDSAKDGVVALARESAAATKAPMLQVLVSSDAEGTTAANTRRLTMQVSNRKGKPCLGLFALLVVIGTSSTGGAGGGHTTSIVTGTTIQTITGNSAYVLFTDASGKVVLDVTIAGAATLYPRVGVLGVMQGTDGFAWA